MDRICLRRVFPVGNGKLELVLASMVITYYDKLFRTRADRYNGILMFLHLLVEETKTVLKRTPNAIFNMKKVDLDES